MDRKLFVATQIVLVGLVGGAVGVSASRFSTAAANASPFSSGYSQTAPADATVPAQDFQDVPVSNPFFGYLHSIYLAGIVSGYNCGGAGEPCVPPYNLPYYRPNSAVTRGQMSKYASLARSQPGININTDSSPQPIIARTTVGGGRAIEGDSVNGNGLHGVSSASDASGVFGQNTNGGFGVAGRSSGSGSAVFGDNNNAGGFAGTFNGNVRVVGTLSKSAGSFQIDDPIDPANKYLSHSFVESPDMMDLYNGNVTLDAKGEATVTMPAWFQALNRDFRYQLTPIGAPGPDLYVAQEIEGNSFKIAGGKADSKVSWQVTGIRQDPYAEQNRIPVEQDKPASEKGLYLNPELYGQPPSKSVVNAPNSAPPPMSGK